MKSEQLKPKKKEKKLSKQDLIFVEKVVKENNLTKAAQESYKMSNPRSAAVKAQRMLTNDNVVEAIEVKRQSLKEALISEGITEKYLAQKVNVLLTATNEKGQEDYTAIDKGLKHATNIYGVVEAPKSEGGNTYNFLFSPETQADIKALEDKIKARLLNKHD